MYACMRASETGGNAGGGEGGRGGGGGASARAGVRKKEKGKERSNVSEREVECKQPRLTVMYQSVHLACEVRLDESRYVDAARSLIG